MLHRSFRNKTKDNSQKRENFWKKLTGSWHEMMGYTDQECRTYQLNSKWKDMSARLMRFSGICSNCANNRKSGMNDEGFSHALIGSKSELGLQIQILRTNLPVCKMIIVVCYQIAGVSGVTEALFFTRQSALPKE
ncbi:hypothetical protein R6Q59_004797 [Mikania micrantha]